MQKHWSLTPWTYQIEAHRIIYESPATARACCIVIALYYIYIWACHSLTSHRSRCLDVVKKVWCMQIAKYIIICSNFGAVFRNFRIICFALSIVGKSKNYVNLSVFRWKYINIGSFLRSSIDRRLIKKKNWLEWNINFIFFSLPINYNRHIKWSDIEGYYKLFHLY